MSWKMITTDDEVTALARSAAESRAVIVDTEFMRRNTFYPQVALVQLCFDGGALDGQALLIDPVELNNTDALCDIFQRPDLVKVLHSASEDLEVFQRWLGVLPEPLFDTQRAAALVNLGFGLGYRNLVKLLCEVDLPKGETRSNWLQRPLTDSQCEYAAQDVTWLLDVWRQLEVRCREEGKFDWVLSDGGDALRAARSNGIHGYYRRIKNAWRLDRQQLATLEAVCEWRETTARNRDKPRSWIIDDKACLQLAQQQPASRNALKASIDIPPGALRRYGDELISLVAGLGELPDESLPEPLPGPLDARQRELVKQLKSRVREIAADIGSAPEVLLQSADYERLVRSVETGEGVAPNHWQGWRKDRVIEPLREVIAP